MKKKAPEGYFTIAEIAEYGHVTKGAIYIGIIHKKIKAEKINRHWFIKKEDYDHYRSNKYNRDNYKIDGEAVFDMEKGHFSIPQVAKILSHATGCRYNKQRIYYSIRKGNLKAFRKGWSWVISKEDAIAFVENECGPSQQQVSFV